MRSGSGMCSRTWTLVTPAQLAVATCATDALTESPLPVARCAVNVDWQSEGMATVFVVRQLANQNFVFGSYLVDALCLGLKDTFCNANLPAAAIQRMLDSTPMEMEAIDYEDARSLILGGIDFAAKIGFAPNPDWTDTQHLIEPARPYVPKFAFGKDGEPLYVAGPRDDTAKILATLHQR